MASYGHRLRIGYTSVAFVTEVFPIEFYRMAPPGVSLSLLTIQQGALDAAEMERLYRRTLQAVEILARADVDIIVLGGRPVMMSRGIGNAHKLLEDLTAQYGRPVLSDATAQLEALRTLGSRRIVTVHPFGEEENRKHDERVIALGFESAGSFAGESSLSALSSLPVEAALEWAQEAVHAFPDADTVMFPCPHWPVVDAIGAIEKEFKITAVSNLQTTLWQALRVAGVQDRIPGYGRLFEAF